LEEKAEQENIAAPASIVEPPSIAQPEAEVVEVTLPAVEEKLTPEIPPDPVVASKTALPDDFLAGKK
jgi:hypothetical protein